MSVSVFVPVLLDRARPELRKQMMRSQRVTSVCSSGVLQPCSAREMSLRFRSPRTAATRRCFVPVHRAHPTCFELHRSSVHFEHRPRRMRRQNSDQIPGALGLAHVAKPLTIVTHYPLDDLGGRSSTGEASDTAHDYHVISNA